MTEPVIHENADLMQVLARLAEIWNYRNSLPPIIWEYSFMNREVLE